MSDLDRQAAVYASAIIKAQERQKCLDRLSRWRSLERFRRTIGVWLVLGIVFYVWHLIDSAGEWFDTVNSIIIFCMCAFIVARQFLPNKKKIEVLESAIEADIEAGRL